MFYKLYDDARDIGAARIAAIGPATAQRVRDFHLKVDLQPDEFVAEAVVREFKKEGDIENLRILIARAEEARDLLPKELGALGAIVDVAVAYRTVAETGDRTEARSRLVGRGSGYDHFYQLIDSREFSRAWPALAGGDGRSRASARSPRKRRGIAA